MKKNIIAISREFGSGGRTIGRLVAQKLGIQFYDRDIIKKVVEESGLTRKYVEHYGEFAPSADQRFAYSFVGLDEDSNSPLVQLWKTREKVIKDFATAKPCVIEAGLKLKNRVKDMDVRRGLNYKYFTGQDWGKAQNYDLALNRGSLGIEKCAQLIVDAASEE